LLHLLVNLEISDVRAKQLPGSLHRQQLLLLLVGSAANTAADASADCLPRLQVRLSV
jgi:hypothetical protein